MINSPLFFLFGLCVLLPQWAAAGSGNFQVLKSENFPNYVFESKSVKHFAPKNEDIDNLEKQLDIFLKNKNPKLAKSFQSYGRQYVGGNVDGRDLIYGNFFCHKSKNWKTHRKLIDVDDGGDCFFQIMFDTKSNTFSNFSINGES